jgi:hypothetical protein
MVPTRSSVQKCSSHCHWPLCSHTVTGLCVLPLPLASVFSHCHWPLCSPTATGLCVLPLSLASVFSHCHWPLCSHTVTGPCDVCCSLNFSHCRDDHLSATRHLQLTLLLHLPSRGCVANGGCAALSGERVTRRKLVGVGRSERAEDPLNSPQVIMGHDVRVQPRWHARCVRRAGQHLHGLRPREANFISGGARASTFGAHRVR